MKIINLFLFLFLLNCKAQEVPDNVILTYQRTVSDTSESYVQFMFDSSKNYLFVHYKSTGLQKTINVNLTQQELRSIYVIYKESNLPVEEINCLYNDDGTISSKAIIDFGKKRQIVSSQKCYQKDYNKNNFYKIETLLLKLIKSKPEYKQTFPWEFENL
ncbi:hypothetical protein EGY07_18990 [Chryseobacterium indologenes]|uniref:hypothetical protein n=1 Tax=Chryseobacterium indologenes TaxID=253 RepID=UPI000F4DAC42|nr:hypothetical protein [Chryseobacterium indologenes]AYZ37473.1 hypothetical protein EGY07_18990 [Chryseobacterium indologenes]MBF6646345.1 hypothetical protein [Chryseobacterium indologenes]MBU3050520.1 hypothetical protein [Chryseobacterium indologenes]MEB4761709.1 hypothetical protein [Chryseobacterium indologenes]QQQ69983.1 hypothetical protein JHW31_15910 [Chryseobacterium indologenes]